MTPPSPVAAARCESLADVRREIDRLDEAITRLLVEGGPTTNGALSDRGLVDELFLTLAPRVVEGRSFGHVGSPSRSLRRAGRRWFPFR